MTSRERELFERATGELSAEFADDPLTELRLWLTLVQRRESALLRTLDDATFLARVPRVARDGAARDELGEAIATALGHVSQHELRHVETLDRCRAALETAADAASFTGRVEGWVVGRAITGRQPWVLRGWLMNASLDAGGTGELLAQVSFVDGCLLWRELEEVAAAGYARMLTLLSLPNREDWCAPLGSALKPTLDSLAAVELPCALAEERFHSALLEQIHAWLSAGGAWPSALTLADAAATIRAVGDRYLTGESHDHDDATRPVDAWIGDAGLGAWLAAHGCEPPLSRANPRP